MNKGTKTVIGVVLLVAIVLVAVGYAAVTSINLTISGTATASVSDKTFVVKFVETPKVDKTKATDATVTANVTGDRAATIEVSGLTKKGEEVSVKYKIQNTTPAENNLKAKVSIKTTDGTNPYFKVTSALSNTESLASGEFTEVTVTVKLLKTPIDPDDVELTTTIGVALQAVAEQGPEQGA